MDKNKAYKIKREKKKKSGRQKKKDNTRESNACWEKKLIKKMKIKTVAKEKCERKKGNVKRIERRKPDKKIKRKNEQKERESQ